MTTSPGKSAMFGSIPASVVGIHGGRVIPPEEPPSREAVGLACPRQDLFSDVAVGRPGDDDDGSRFRGRLDGGWVARAFVIRRFPAAGETNDLMGFFVTMGENLLIRTDATVGAAEGRSRISCVSKIES